MLTYTPGSSVVHRLDPRSKLCFQFGFAIAAFVQSTIPRLFGLFLLGAGCLVVAGLSIRRALRAYWVILLVLSLGPLIAGATVGSPWFDTERAGESLQSVARVVPILLVSAAYVHATPVRETRAAIQHTLPGRAGQLLGMGVALTFRYVPVLRADLREIRDALAARAGDQQPFRERAETIATLSLLRALSRADELSLALQARCFAWNPTLPSLQFTRLDYAVSAAGIALGIWPVAVGIFPIAAGGFSVTGGLFPVTIGLLLP